MLSSSGPRFFNRGQKLISDEKAFLLQRSRGSIRRLLITHLRNIDIGAVIKRQHDVRKVPAIFASVPKQRGNDIPLESGRNAGQFYPLVFMFR
ncbi:hypothetical protein AFLA_009256 [Aspergillus flavus NRRL3357]|nr:hypothetical protein AFLA_009256 [Aspergillus flavus NRRL3357]